MKLLYQNEILHQVGKMVPHYNLCSIRFKLQPHWNCNLACKLAHSSWRRRVPVWLRRNLHYSNLCARTHLSLWPGGSHRQQPGGHLCLCVHGCVCMCVCVTACSLVSVIMWVQQEVVLRSLGAWFQVSGPVYCHKFQNGDYLLQK